MAHIFISYSTKNSEYANKLALRLRQEGFDVWIDNAKLRASEDWWASIVKALWSCSAFIVLLSPESDESKWVQRELTIADQRNKPTFPILIDGDMNRPNWQVFVRTQVVFHTDGSLPDREFYDQLASVVARRTEGGRDLTKDDDAIQDVAVNKDLSDEIANKPEPEDISPIINQSVTTDQRSNVTRQQTMGNQQNQQISEKERTWNSAVIIGTIIALLSLIVGVIAILPEAQRNNLFGIASPTEEASPESSPQASSVQTSGSATDIPTPITTQSGESGAYEVALIYGEQNSLTLLVNEPSTLWNVTLDTSGGVSKNLMQEFPDLALLGEIVQTGTCLQYERADTSPVLPFGCDPDLVQRETLNGADVFWFNDSTNQYANVVLRRDDDTPQLCSHDNGSGRCDFSATE